MWSNRSPQNSLDYSPRQITATSITLAVALLTCWVLFHIIGLWFVPLGGWVWLAAPLLIALLCWLNVGLFIIAHDCMHGSFAPGHIKTNRFFGTLCLALYAGFSYSALLPAHNGHHKAPGSAGDPDFHANDPHRFWPWYWRFLRYYFGMQQLLVLNAVFMLLWIVQVPLANLLTFWALPAILSSLQLFYFGTYLPHRHHTDTFSDHHNARTNDFPEWLSLLTCFHFGYHHEHHLSPRLCWWQLPDGRRRQLAGDRA